MSTRRHIVTRQEAESLAEFLVGLSPPFTVSWTEGGKRSLDQNALLHKWYGEVASQSRDTTAMQVKGQCHVAYGLPIRLRDEAFAWVWKQSGARLSYEKQCRLFERGTFAMTSAMTTKELSEYMDAMSRDYRAEGFRLTDPEAAKYEKGA
jgi:hypothetical protein